MIDTHAHLNFKRFEDDYAQVIGNNFNQGLKAVINVGSNLETSKKAIKISLEFKNCFSAIGLHPVHINDENFEKEQYTLLINKNKDKIKAIGETGLDFFHDENSKDLQKKVFLQHIELAQKHDLPVIMHCRGNKDNPSNAYLELLETIKNLKQTYKGVIHCFSSDWVIAQEFLNLGFYIGFDGPITFKNSTPELLQVVKKAPLNRILLETDSPFLAPEPYRGQRNEPIYVRFIAQKISEVKNLDFNQVVIQTTKNAKKLFKL